MSVEVTKGLSGLILLSVSVYLFTQFITQFTESSINEVKRIKEDKEHIALLNSQIASIQKEVASLKKGISTASADTNQIKINLKTDELNQKLGDVNKRLNSIEGAIQIDPTKVYSLTTIQKDIEKLQVKVEKDFQSVDERQQKLSDRIDAILNSLFAAVVGILLLTIPSFIKSLRNPASKEEASSN